MMLDSEKALDIIKCILLFSRAAYLKSQYSWKDVHCLTTPHAWAQGLTQSQAGGSDCLDYLWLGESQSGDKWGRIHWCTIGYIYSCCFSAVIVTDDTALLILHPSDHCFDSIILAKQATVLTVVDITDWSSVTTAHQHRPAVVDDWVTVAQQMTHIQVMGLALVSNTSILPLNGLVQKQPKGNTNNAKDNHHNVKHRTYHFKYICFSSYWTKIKFSFSFLIFQFGYICLTMM